MAMVNRTAMAVISIFFATSYLAGCSSAPNKQYKAPVVTAKSNVISKKNINLNKNITQRQINTNTARQHIVAQAKAQLGQPYRLGGTTPKEGFDCSGLVHYTHKNVGLDLPRRSVDQYHASKKSTTVQPGDLLFFSINSRGKRVDHVGIYIGNNQFVHAPGRGKPVRVADVTTDYWKRKFIGTGTYLD